MDEEEPPELWVALMETTTVTGETASTFTPTLYGKLGRSVFGAMIVYDGGGVGDLQKHKYINMILSIIIDSRYTKQVNFMQTAQ